MHLNYWISPLATYNNNNNNNYIHACRVVEAVELSREAGLGEANAGEAR